MNRASRATATNANLFSAAIWLVLALFSPLISSHAASHGFVIRNVRIFDGEKVIAANTVSVADGKIIAVGSNLPIPAGAEVVNGSGDTLLPGLIDSHVHLWNRDVLRIALVMGVTTELDMYMRRQDARPWKEEEAKGAFDIADFRTAGTCFTVAGGHGTEPPFPQNTPIRDPSQARAFVDERIAHGSDYIKIMYDNGPGFAAMPKDVMQAIVNAAHRRGKMVVVHAFSAQAYLDAIDAGVDGLAHVPIVKLPEPEFRDAIKAHHIFAITTLGFTDFHFGEGRLWARLPEDPMLGPYLSSQLRPQLQGQKWNAPGASYADNQANLRILRDARVPLLAGTDASNTVPAGILLHAEIELMVQAGLTPAEVLADATSVPAQVFSLSDRGRIAPGLRADLLLVRDDPTRDIRATRSIAAVWKQGVRVDRESLRETVAQEDEAWRFGAGWFPWTTPGSTVRISTISGGPAKAASTMIVSGDVKAGAPSSWAGVSYFTRGDISGLPQMSFWVKGDGKTYSVTLFARGVALATKHFSADRDWHYVAFPFSDFGTDGSNVGVIGIGSEIPGSFRFELSHALMGKRRPRPWLGLELDNRTEGAKVESVDEGSPAQKSGIKPGDSIVGFNRKRVETYNDVVSLMSGTRVNQRIPIEIERDGKRQTIIVEIGARP